MTKQAPTRNWRTTTAAILLAISALTSGAAALLDDDPATEPDYPLIVLTCISAAGFAFAADAQPKKKP